MKTKLFLSTLLMILLTVGLTPVNAQDDEFSLDATFIAADGLVQFNYVSEWKVEEHTQSVTGTYQFIIRNEAAADIENISDLSAGQIYTILAVRPRDEFGIEATEETELQAFATAVAADQSSIEFVAPERINIGDNVGWHLVGQRLEDAKQVSFIFFDAGHGYVAMLAAYHSNFIEYFALWDTYFALTASAKYGIIGEPLVFGQPFSSSLSAGQPQNWAFDGVADGQVVISLSMTEFSPVISLLDGGGNLLAQSTATTGIDVTLKSQPLPNTDSYIVAISGITESEAGVYVLQVELILDGTAVTGTATSTSTSTPQPDDDAPLNPSTRQLIYDMTAGDNLLREQVHPYTFTGTQGDIIRIVTDSDAFSPLVIFSGPDGEEIIRDDPYSGQTTIIGPLAIEATGTYRIEVRGVLAFSRGDYTITIEQLDEQQVLGGGNLTYGDGDSTYLLLFSADEWFFDGQQGDAITITVTTQEFNARTALVAPSGEETVFVATGDFTDRLDAYVLPETGVYGIRIDSGFSQAGAGRYTISLQRHIDDPPDTFQSSSLNYGDSRTVILEAGDLHVWAFNGRRGDIVTITVRSTDFNPEIFLYGSNSSFITYNDDYEGSTNPTINEWELEEFGQYVITVESRSVLTGGLYTISLIYGEGS